LLPDRGRPCSRAFSLKSGNILSGEGSEIFLRNPDKTGCAPRPSAVIALSAAPRQRFCQSEKGPAGRKLSRLPGLRRPDRMRFSQLYSSERALAKPKQKSFLRSKICWLHALISLSGTP
jgi:hypothetical protein